MNVLDMLPLTGNIAFLHRVGYRTKKMSYESFNELMLKAETYIRKKGVRKGDKILFQAANSPLYAALFLATLRRGAVAIPLEAFTSCKQRKKIEKLTKPKLIITDPYKREEAIEKCKPCKIRAAVTEDEVAEIVFTSGTTGDPKGVILTHKNLMAGLEAAQACLPMKKLRFISVLPLSHMLEQMGTLFLALSTKATILYPGTQRYSELLDLIKYKRINMMVSVPGILEGLQIAIKARKAAYRKIVGMQFRIIGVGGAPLPYHVERWWSRRAFVFQGYGMTEASLMISMNTLFAKRKRSVGKSVKGVEIRIKKGEIQAKGPNISPGYYKNPEASVKLFDGAWLCTGDQGEIKNGFLYIKGRKKEMILTASGINVYPSDIEEVLQQEVKDSCIIQKGKNIHAILFTKQKGEDIIKRVNKKLEAHQRIASYTIVQSALPRTPTGKIKKKDVEKLIKKKQRKAKDPLYALLQEVLQQRVKEKSLAEQGLDSLKRMELLAKIEEYFGVELAEQAITEKTKPKDLAKSIEDQTVQFYDFHLPKLRHVGRAVGKGLAFAYCKLNKPKWKPFHGIIAANHVSSLDVPLLSRVVKGDYAAGALPLFFVKTGEWGSKGGLWIARFVFKHFISAIPFGPDVGLERSMRYVAHLLDEGFNFILFPEGQRTLDGKMNPFRPGIGYLLAHMNVPVLPVRTRGLENVLPRGKVFPQREKVTVRLGKPITFSNQSYIGIARKLKTALKKL